MAIPIFSFEEDLKKNNGICKYAMLILYSERNIKLMDKFFEINLKKLNNERAHVDIYTYYDKDMIKSSFAMNDYLKKLFDLIGVYDGFQSMAEYKKKFRVEDNKYPIVIVVNKNTLKEDNDRFYCNDGYFSSSNIRNLKLSTMQILYKYIDFCIEAINDNPNSLIVTIKSKMMERVSDIISCLISEDRELTPKQYIDNLRKRKKITIGELCSKIGVERHMYGRKLDGKVKGIYIDRGFIISIMSALNLNAQEKEEYCEYFSYLNIKEEEMNLDEIYE